MIWVFVKMMVISMENKEQPETRHILGGFTTYSKDVFRKNWQKIIGSNDNLRVMVQKQVDNALIIKSEDRITNVQALLDLMDDEVMITWNDKDGKSKKMVVMGDDFIGVQVLKDGQQGMVVMKNRKDAAGKNKAEITTFYL